MNNNNIKLNMSTETTDFNLTSNDLTENLVKTKEPMATQNDFKSIPDYKMCGISRTSQGITLKLGTLLKSAGNSRSIERNITKQLEKRLTSYNLKYVNCVKFCVPIVDFNTEFCVREAINNVFPTKTESFDGTNEKYPDSIFVKVLLNQEPDLKRIFLGTFSKATGSLENVKKFILKQLESQLELKKEIIEQNNLIEFEVPNVTAHTYQALSIILTEKFGENKFIINSGYGNTLYVIIELN